jgi:hypothetical protein
MTETVVRTPEPGDLVRFRDPDTDEERPMEVDYAGEGGWLNLLSYGGPNGLNFNRRCFVPHGDVRTASGVWSFPDELEPHWLPDA